MKLLKYFTIARIVLGNDAHTDGVLDIESEDFQNLSKKEQSSMLEKIFVKMDADQSEKIEKSEMVEWAWHIERKYMTDHVNAWVRILLKN